MLLEGTRIIKKIQFVSQKIQFSRPESIKNRFIFAQKPLTDSSDSSRVLPAKTEYSIKSIT